MKKFLILVLVLTLGLTGCLPEARDPVTVNENESKEEESIFGGSNIVLATTLPQESGLLNELIPQFADQMKIRVKTIHVGIDEGVEMAQNGEVDVLFINSKEDELELINNGDVVYSNDVMEGEIVLIGPKDDILSTNDILGALRTISTKNLPFVSGGSDSLSSRVEDFLWNELGVVDKDSWYQIVESKMRDTILKADELRAYALVDKESFLNLKDDLDLEIIVEGESLLKSQFSVMTIDPTKSPVINELGSLAFANWLVFGETQLIIKEFGIDKYGEALYRVTPNN